MRGPRGHGGRLLCYALALGQAFWGLGCSDEISAPSTGTASTAAGVLGAFEFGELTFQLYRNAIASEPAGAPRDARLAALDARHDDFVQAVDDVANPRTLGGVVQSVEAIFALVDDGTLPTLTDQTAGALELLAQDPQAMAAVLDLVQSKGHTVPTRELVDLIGRALAYPESAETWEAVAALIRENDGLDDAGQPNGEPTLVPDLLALLRDALLDFANGGAPGSQLGQALDDLAAELTAEAPIHGALALGDPEWVVRLDARGLPRVAHDPATGGPTPPFADRDGDGLADADADGRLLDAQGRPVDLPTFGPPNDPGRDAAGRAIDGAGRPVYVYVDAKRTVLSLLLIVGGELLDREVHNRAHEVLEAGLGPVRPDGTYGRDHPVADLAWGGLGLLRSDHAPQALRTAADVLRRDPDLAERLLVRVSRAKALAKQAAAQGAGGRRLSDPQVVRLIDDLLPILDDIFEQPGSGPSTARTLTDTLADLRTRAPDFGPQLAPLFVHSRVARESQPDGDRNSIDEARSVPVDFSQPAGQGNRSAAQQLLDLLARADGCDLFGRNLAVLILDLMADQSPATVGNLASLVTSLPGFLSNLVCSGISNDIQALDALATSGALDGFLPLAKAFKDRGETELLVRLLVRVQQDYDVIRSIEPDVARYLDAGVLDEAGEIARLGRQVTDPVTGDSAADIFAFWLEELVDDDVRVVDRRGAVVPSRAHLLLGPLQAFDRRLVAAGRTPAWEALVDGLFDVLLARVQSGGRDRLRNAALIPLLTEGIGAVADRLPADRATRLADVDRARAGAVDLLASRDFATVLTLIRTIDQAPSKALLNRGLVSLFTPRQRRQDDVFGAIVRLAVILVQAPPDPGALQDLAPWLAQVVDPQSPLVPDALQAFQRLLTAEEGRTVLNLLRAAFTPPPGEVDAPVLVLLDVFRDVQDAGGPAGALDVPALEAHLRDAVAFLRDDTQGVGWYYAAIRARRR